MFVSVLVIKNQVRQSMISSTSPKHVRDLSKPERNLWPVNKHVITNFFNTSINKLLWVCIFRQHSQVYQLHDGISKSQKIN